MEGKKAREVDRLMFSGEREKESEYTHTCT